MSRTQPPRDASDAGDAELHFKLGCAFAQGDGVPQDDAKAVELFRLAADLGHVQAQCNLALLHLEGRGVKKSHEEAARWYRKAAERGLAQAQYNLGVLYEEGWGLPQSDADAIRWWRKAAAQGDDLARQSLARIFAEWICPLCGSPDVEDRGGVYEFTELHCRKCGNSQLTDIYSRMDWQGKAARDPDSE